MSVKNQQKTQVQEGVVISELDEHERMVIRLFRLLDELTQKDVVRLLNILIKKK